MLHFSSARSAFGTAFRLDVTDGCRQKLCLQTFDDLDFIDLVGNNCGGEPKVFRWIEDREAVIFGCLGNSFKSEPIKFLFVCSRNKKRSRTAEEIFKSRPGIQVKSAGTEPSARIKVTEGMIGWADIILVMEKKHAAILRQDFQQTLIGKRLRCLDIPDDYEFMDPDLIGMLESVVVELLNTP